MNNLNQEKNSVNNIFSGKNCLITGATGGLGKEIAKLLAKKNCNLFLTGTTNSKLSVFGGN